MFADHTTSYIHGEDSPLGLTLAWGYDGGFWWGKRQLKGTHTIRFAVLPHEGDWESAGLWNECEAYLYNPVVQRVLAGSGNYTGLEISPAQVILSAAYQDGGSLFIRLFNASRHETKAALRIAQVSKIERVELDGAYIEDIYRQEDGTAELILRSFQIITLRIL